MTVAANNSMGWLIPQSMNAIAPASNSINPYTLAMLNFAAGMMSPQPTYGAFGPQLSAGIKGGVGGYMQGAQFNQALKSAAVDERYKDAMIGYYGALGESSKAESAQKAQLLKATLDFLANYKNGLGGDAIGAYPQQSNPLAQNFPDAMGLQNQQQVAYDGSGLGTIPDVEMKGGSLAVKNKNIGMTMPDFDIEGSYLGQPITEEDQQFLDYVSSLEKQGALAQDKITPQMRDRADAIAFRKGSGWGPEMSLELLPQQQSGIGLRAPSFPAGAVSPNVGLQSAAIQGTAMQQPSIIQSASQRTGIQMPGTFDQSHLLAKSNQLGQLAILSTPLNKDLGEAFGREATRLKDVYDLNMKYGRDLWTSENLPDGYIRNKESGAVYEMISDKNDPRGYRYRFVPTDEIYQKGLDERRVAAGEKAESAAAVAAGKAVGEDDIATFKLAQNAKYQEKRLNELIKLIETGNFATGPAYELETNLQRIRAKFMDDIKAGKQVNEAQVIDAFLGSDVFPLIGQLGIGARGIDTPDEKRFLLEVFTGTRAMTKETLRDLAILRLKASAKAVDEWNAIVEDGVPDYLQTTLRGRAKPMEPVIIPMHPGWSAEEVK